MRIGMKFLNRMKYRSKLIINGLLAFGILLSALSASLYIPGVRSSAEAGLDSRPVCSAPSHDAAQCLARVVTQKETGKPFATSTFSRGYTPADLRSAYALPSPTNTVWAWNGETIAIVDAYDNPNAEQDLLTYRKQFNLPVCNDGTVNCLFQKVNQNGSSSPLPQPDVNWGSEIDLDIQMASAICPNCKVLLVEAASNGFSDIGSAVDRAALMGANAISNSYGASEFAYETSNEFDGHYNHPGIAMTASSGDWGYGVYYPAVSRYVTAVGGTSLVRSSGSPRGWSETAWSGAGSGCSQYETKPSWQPQIGNCFRRTVSDVSAVADPATGVAVYNSFGSSNGANWYVFGGTSVSAPIIAGVYALAGNAGGSTPAINYGEYPYSHRSSLYDVTSGSNGRCVKGRNNANAALCTAVSGFDGPTGLGTPNGTGAF